MKIYLAHSIDDYENNNIKNEKINIKNKFGLKHDYEDPSTYDFGYLKVPNRNCEDPEKEWKTFSENATKELKKKFFPIIKDCNLFIAIPNWKTNKYSFGVISELEYAQKQKIEIYEWKFIKGK